ncbi:hypothetical protein BCR35DRAFT_305012 [Leucosporidium creatinivorum]|uniref:NAD-dependent epimerase/dehydratase domain-containing protein n=1 Tax=Leucosporidium creatinivorum TaxID=106004 RepID=A0A1Y2F3G8_9BASI|nr:hypothetical protein BCR35DRAFT_305012 [Leucosporidium creatinivorum]
MAPAQRLLILGGSGLVGSSVAKKAVARGWEVISLSRKGTPYKTPAGHVPAWANQVDWRSASAFQPSSYSSLLPSCTAVVSTLGILLEGDSYKSEGQASPLGVLKGVVKGFTGDRGNPLGEREGEKRSYERMNRDAALTLFNAFRSSTPSTSSSSTSPSPFIYISAEDIFRPFIPSRYISTKREAERLIELGASASEKPGEGGRSIRPVFVRPSDLRPSARPSVPSLRLSTHLTPSPTAAPTDLPPALTSLAALLSIPPIHVDAVGEAVVRAVEREEVRGVLGVKEIRRMLGFEEL